LRSATKGRGSYTMEFLCFEGSPQEVQKQFGVAGEWGVNFWGNCGVLGRENSLFLFTIKLFDGF